MLNKTIESELNIAASKKKWLIYMIIYILSLVCTAATLFVYLTHRTDYYMIMIILMLVMLLLNAWWVRKLSAKTQSVMANLMMNDDSLLISYSNVEYGEKSVNIVVTVPYDQIQRLEYSDRLDAFRFVGKFDVRMDGQKAEIARGDEWVLYVKDDDSLAEELEKSTKQHIISVGSKTEKWGISIRNL